MNITSILRAGSLALVLAAAIGSSGAAFADSENLAVQPPQAQQNANTGPYDGADYQAAKNAWF
jgi:hypothetical protein